MRTAARRLHPSGTAEPLRETTVAIRRIARMARRARDGIVVP
jgi:hypothetical protein